jgi:drug/metabolite transporter (DMT)-like permease
VAGSFLTLIPVFGLAAAAILGETLTIRQWIGAALVLGAIGALVMSQAQRQPNAPSIVPHDHEVV